jgi:NTP pyrophosphatase (non-canonical NTP hydrolase)
MLTHAIEDGLAQVQKEIDRVYTENLPFKTLVEIQREIGEWALEQFGNNRNRSAGHPGEGAPLGAVPPLLGMNEEVGEVAGLSVSDAHVAFLSMAMMKLNHASVYRLQGRGDYHLDDKLRKELTDGLSDLFVFACDFANRQGISLAVALNETWEKVSRRRRATWNQDKAAEAAPAASLSPEEHGGPAQVG